MRIEVNASKTRLKYMVVLYKIISAQSGGPNGPDFVISFSKSCVFSVLQ